MRIRKNANLSSLMLSHASGVEQLQTHVCQLNQSPWDVIPFHQEAYPSSLHQLEGEDSFNGNGSLVDSIGAVESSSVHSYAEDNKKLDNMVMDDNYEISEKKRVLEHYDNLKIGKKCEKIQCCNKSDGKGWHCKKECDHHLTLLNSCPAYIQSSKKPDKPLSSGRRGRSKAAKKGTSSASNPYEFYYYSGFGPLWGKRRGGDKGKEAVIDGINIGDSTDTDYPLNSTPSPTPSPINHREEFDFVDEDDEDEEEDIENGKKRMRKPVKARSLKSLM